MSSKKYLSYDGLVSLWSVIKNKLEGKVDKEDGKQLSTNDYTADEKAKLANIATGAEVNVNADWNASTGDAAILNKPTIPSATSQLTNDSGFITSIPLATKTTLGGVIVGNYINVANDGTISLDVATDAQVDAFLYENGLLTTNTIDSATIDNATVA